MAKAKAARGFYDQNTEPKEVRAGETFEASDEVIRGLREAGLVDGAAAKAEPAPANKAEAAPANKAEAPTSRKSRKG